ncbi:Fe-S cluster assembly protein SufD [Candidatus Woesearchaeota archaeon]|nr:Fe-S cluster assembly protein SufD [Candidatus Woesearchaeota archaeon]
MMQQTTQKAKMTPLTKVKSGSAEKEKAKHLKSLNELPMPEERQEAWRYTNISKFRLNEFYPFDGSAEISVSDSTGLKEKGVILCDINTAFNEHTDIINRNTVKNNSKAYDKFTALNASHWSNGIFLYVPKNVSVEIPVNASFLISTKSAVVRNIIIAETGSKIDFIEEYSSDSGEECLHSCATEVYAGADSKINYYHINNWGNNAGNFTHITGVLDRNAAINWVSASFGGKLNRLRIDTLFNGEGSQSENLGVFVGRSREHIDITTNVYHNTAHTTNNIMVDGILKDSSSSVYRGLIRIEKAGQQTNSYLSNHILKIGEKSLGNSIPALEIEANDVKASHGATVGQVSEEHLFYLMSRGLTREDAENMIVQGFLEPIISKIPSEELREKIRGLITR